MKYELFISKSILDLFSSSSNTRGVFNLSLGTKEMKPFNQNLVLYVQEVVTLQKKDLIYLHQKMRFTAFINYYDTLG